MNQEVNHIRKKLQEYNRKHTDASWLCENPNKVYRIRIKEDAINLQLHDISDTLQSWAKEINKTVAVLWALWIIITVTLSWIALNKYQLVILWVLILLLLSIILINLLTRKVWVHNNVDSIFITNSSNYEGYLWNKHLTLRKQYESVQLYLWSKIRLNKRIYWLLVTIILTIYLFTIMNNIGLDDDNNLVQKNHEWTQVEINPPINDQNFVPVESANNTAPTVEIVETQKSSENVTSNN